MMRDGRMEVMRTLELPSGACPQLVSTHRIDCTRPGQAICTGSDGDSRRWQRVGNARLADHRDEAGTMKWKRKYLEQSK